MPEAIRPVGLSKAVTETPELTTSANMQDALPVSPNVSPRPRTEPATTKELLARVPRIGDHRPRPYSATHGHKQPHTATHGHTRPHTATHTHTHTHARTHLVLVRCTDEKIDKQGGEDLPAIV